MQLLVYQEAPLWRRVAIASFHGGSGFAVSSSTALYAHSDTRDSEPNQFSNHCARYSGESLEGMQDKDDRKNVRWMEYVSTDMQVYHHYPFGLTFLRLVARIFNGK